MAITKVFALDGVIVAWKADNSSILCSFSCVLGAPVLGFDDKDFLVKVMDEAAHEIRKRISYKLCLVVTV